VDGTEARVIEQPLAGRRGEGRARRAAGIALFVAGAGVVTGALLLGRLFLPELQGEGARPLATLPGTWAWARLLGFGFGLPAGLGLGLTGAAVLGGATPRRVALFVLLAAAAVALMCLVPGLFGRQRSPTFFGSGGVAIAVLFFASAWQWARWRLSLARRGHAGADLLAVGQLCFAVAAWNVCGVGGMPGYAIYPERMAAIGSQALAVANLKVVMAFFVLGWLFTLIGFRLAARAGAAESR